MINVTVTFPELMLVLKSRGPMDVSISVEELQLLIQDAEDWTRVNEISARAEDPGPKRDSFMRQALELQTRANELRKLLP